MSDDDSSQEKTEEPTSKRLEKAKEDGQAPRSRELTTTAVILTGSVGLLIFGGIIARKLEDIMRYNFALSREAILDPATMFSQLGNSFYDALYAVVPLFVVLMAAAFGGPIALGGWLFSLKSLAPKLSRIDPLAGLKRMFSLKSLVELAKAIGKILLIIFVAYGVLQLTKYKLMGLSSESVEAAIIHSLQISVFAAIILSAATIAIAAIDIPFQIFEHTKKMKMSNQEVKDELKDSEGKPEVKGKIRQLQQQMAQQRMMSSVPEADVVITNPTHYAIALKYDPHTMETPLMLAKGLDHTAIRIREVAKAHNIEFVQAPALARAIYHTTELGEEIPRGLYLAVAQVLAYVFQLREYRRGRTPRPNLPNKLDIPKDMQY